MKSLQKTLIVIILLTSTILSTAQNNPDKLYQDQWKNIESFIKKGKPRSALKVVEEIYADAKINQNHQHLLKAYLYQLRLTSDFEEDFLEKIINQIDQDISSSIQPSKSIFQSIKAQLLYTYLNKNQYQIKNRTNVKSEVSNDIRVWSYNEFQNAIRNSYLKSIENKDLLSSIPLKDYELILEESKNTEQFYTTLYDLLAHRAIQSLSDDSWNQDINPFGSIIDKDECFKTAPEFIKLDLEMNPHSNHSIVLNIFQGLSKHLLASKNPKGLIDLEIERIKWIKEISRNPDRETLYLNYLIKLISQYRDYPEISRAYFNIAQKYYDNAARNESKEKDLYKEALIWCNEAIEKYPKSIGALKCESLKNDILNSAVNVTINRAILPSQRSTAMVSYRNVDTLYFKIISEDKLINNTNYNEREERWKTLNQKSSIKEWMLPIENPMDYNFHNMQFNIPALEVGHYHLLVSKSDDFKWKNNIVGTQEFWVSNLSFVKRNNGPVLEVSVLDRLSGKSISDVKINIWNNKYDYKTRKHSFEVKAENTTNQEGLVEFRDIDIENYGNSYIFELNKGNDRFASESFYYYSGANYEPPTTPVEYIYTDRSIYRPGQSIYFKGFTFKRNGKGLNIDDNATVEVSLYDANNKELSKQRFKSNAYGSYQGSFIIPTGVLNGQFRISTKHTSSYIRVEDYKRPQFEVLFDTLSGQFEIGDSITVSGQAKAFASYAVEGAKVQYRISVQANSYNPWGMGRYPYYFEEIDLASGILHTDLNGKFEVKFKAFPHPKAISGQPIKHSYTIYADVTDINGESQTGQETYSIGGPALVLDINIPNTIDIHNPQKYKISSLNSDDQPVQSEGTLFIYQLENDERPLRPYKFGARPDVFNVSRQDFVKTYPYEVYSDEDLIEKKNVEKEVFQTTFNTKNKKEITLQTIAKLTPGYYRIILKSKDEKGKNVQVEKNVLLIDSESKKMPAKKILWHHPVKTNVEPGETAIVLIGSSLKTTFKYELEHKGKIIHAEKINLNNSVKQIEIPITEAYRGDVFVHLTAVAQNTILNKQIRIRVPFSNKDLSVKLSTFRDKITPGSEEEWKITIKDYNDQVKASELMVNMYDASLDQFTPHYWNMNLYSHNYSTVRMDRDLCFITRNLYTYNSIKKKIITIPQRVYPALNWFGFNLHYGYFSRTKYKSEAMMLNIVEDDVDIAYDMELEIDKNIAEEISDSIPAPSPGSSNEKINAKPRTDFRETAFFFPQLYTNEQGEVIFKFKAPEALTQWKFMALAHSKDLEYGLFTEDNIVTSKELMVIPNAPRFYREDDQMLFNAKVVNTSDSEQHVDVSLKFFDAVSMKEVSKKVMRSTEIKSIRVPANQSAAIDFSIHIPEGMLGLVYRIEASGDAFSDGEEKIIPVLPNRMLVTETLPLWANANELRTFTLENLIKSDQAKGDLKHFNLSLEMTSNPVWYAVQSLPYLMEYPYECNEQIFSRYYANALASHIVNSNPEIKRVFNIWKDYQPEALLSALEKNQELKNIILEATPWVQQAQNETEQKRRIALLFDVVRMSSQLQITIDKLQQNQLSSGAWSWFGKKWPSRYITTHIVNGFAKLNHLGVINIQKDYQLRSMINKAMSYLDSEMVHSYNEIMKHSKKPENYIPGSLEILNLYMRSFDATNHTLDKKSQLAYDYFFKQSEKFWLKQNKYQQGMIALVMHRSGKNKIADAVIESLKEHAIIKEELGMSWRDFESGGIYWNQAKIESQAMMIEAFEEISSDRKSVDQMRKWLLKNKQTNNWGTTKATVEAIYALLLRGTDQLSNHELVEVRLGGERVKTDPTQLEAGTGYFKVSWNETDIKPDMGKIEVNNPNNNPVWGGLYWQYYQDLDAIESQNSSLAIEKEFFVERVTESGIEIEPIEKAIIEIGDKLIVRIIIKTDRDLEYVHLQDMRASALEPIEVLSGYKYKDGLWFYQSMRDTSADFFFDQLARGTYVFEYPLRVSQKGSFSNGISTIQCMYAPQFSAHSSGKKLKIN